MSLPLPPGKSITESLIEIRGQVELAKCLAGILTLTHGNYAHLTELTFLVASLTLVLYDWLISLDLECAFIWGRKWTWGRLIYHLNRVWPVVLLWYVV